MNYLPLSTILGLVLISCGTTAPKEAGSANDRVLVRFHDTGEIIQNNPHKGLMTFQRFNGDAEHPLEGCCGGFREGFPFPVLTDSDGNLYNEDYPNTSIAYFRYYWRYIEPEQGEYRWDIIDQTLETARERGQTVMLAVMSHGSPYEDIHDVPDWYREMVGERREWAHDSPVHAWMVDPEDPRYNEHFGGVIRKMGERYDGHPDLEGVDVRIVGAWGEGAGSAILTQPTREALVNAYSDSFKKTPLIMLLTDENTNKYGMTQADMSYRFDCMGDLDFWAAQQDGWSHMYDYYPEGIINYGMQNAWEKAAITYEICGYFNTWKDRRGYGLEEAGYIFEQGLKWRMSSFNAKSHPVPEEWNNIVDEWIRDMGYRFVLRRFSYPREVAPNSKLDFTSWWENKGVAPIYHKYPLVLRLHNGNNRTVLLTDADIRDWMPGDILFNSAVFVPHDMAPGEYELEFALIKPLRVLGKEPEPAIQLPIDAGAGDGWYRLGPVTVTAK